MNWKYTSSQLRELAEAVVGAPGPSRARDFWRLALTRISPEQMIAFCDAVEALRPLAAIAEAIDGSPTCAEHKRPDDAPFWESGTALTLTMGHARAALAALRKAEGREA